MASNLQRMVGVVTLLAFLTSQAMCALHAGHCHEAHGAGQCAQHVSPCGHHHHAPASQGTERRDDQDDDEHDGAPSPCTCVICQLGLQVAVVQDVQPELPTIAVVPGERVIAPAPVLVRAFLSFHVFGPRSPPEVSLV